MEELRKKFVQIPWSSFGRESAIARLSRSVLPVGNFPTRLPSAEYAFAIELGSPDYEKYLMDIIGTAFQAGPGKLLTCWHVCEQLRVKEGHAYVQSTSKRGSTILKLYWSILSKCNFIDPRTSRGNKEVDVGILLCPTLSTKERPYDVPVVKWGDSTKLSVGHQVLIGGFPLGTKLFLALATNRGVVQPTFYDGVVSAIIPATRPTETRLLQISSIAIGGISGGVVCDARTGAVLGMVTSGLEDGSGHALPMTYAIPSEVLRPWAEAISYKTEGDKLWK